MDKQDAIYNLIESLSFHEIIVWAHLLEVEVNYPPIDDMWPDWENELRVEVGEKMAEIGAR